MCHQYSHLCEQTVHVKIWYYISTHPNVAHIPIGTITTAFKDGVDKDPGLLDSHLPYLTTVVAASK